MSCSLCVAVCAHSVALRHFSLSQLCMNNPPGSPGLSHLLSACWTSSNLAASEEETGAVGVGSPRGCQKSSVNCPYRRALQAPRKLTRWGDRGGGDTVKNFFLFMLQRYYSFIKYILHDPRQWSFHLGKLTEERKKMKWTSLYGSWATDQKLSLLLSISWCNFLRVTHIGLEINIFFQR